MILVIFEAYQEVGDKVWVEIRGNYIVHNPKKRFAHATEKFTRRW